MATGLEALGAASAVLQVISFASDLAVACKNAYDGTTTRQDDLERHAKQMLEAVGRVHARCEKMANANSKFASPDLQNIAQECKDAAEKLQKEVQYVTRMQAKGNPWKSLRKALRASSHQRKLQTLEESLSRYYQVMKVELTSHLCSQSDAIHHQQDTSFDSLDSDVQSLINQLAQGITDVLDSVQKEHTVTRTVFTQETARAEMSINAHTDSQMLELKSTTETREQSKAFLLSLKAPRMNERFNEIMDSVDASFNQVFATYKEMAAMYYEDSEYNSDSNVDSLSEEGDDLEQDHGEEGEDDKDHDDDAPTSYQSSEGSSDLSHTTYLDDIYGSWDSLNSWLQSDDVLFYIEGKPGSGKSTLVKFILAQDRTRDLILQWSPDATIISYFFWKIGSHEQNSIKGLWCALLYQRLQSHIPLISKLLEHFQHLSLHTSYHDWTIKDLQLVWEYAMTLDDRHQCIFIDGLDEIRNEDGFCRLAQSIQLLSSFPRTKLCVSTRPEAQIVRWLGERNTSGIRLEDLTKLDMTIFVRTKLRSLLSNEPDVYYSLRRNLVEKAQGVFLWLHLATRSLIEGIENGDTVDTLIHRLHGLPEDLETLYIAMWQRLNANNAIYRQTAARYFRYVLHSSSEAVHFVANGNWPSHLVELPFSLQIACAESPDVQEAMLGDEGTIEKVVIRRLCQGTNTSIRTRCAGLLEFQPLDNGRVEDSDDGFKNAFGKIAFIHRTAHDFLVDTETGRRILEHEPSSDMALQHRLLNGLICAMTVSSSRWNMAWELSHVIEEITCFAKGWGSQSLELAHEVLDALRHVYEKRCFKTAEGLWGYRCSFFNFLTHDDSFDGFVISRLTAESSVRKVTDTLREGWSPRSHTTLSKRLFDALLSLGADPHEAGEDSRYAAPGPFLAKVTAFTNLLVCFYLSRENYFGHYYTRHSTYEPRLTGCKRLYLNESCEITEMAMNMARSCNYFNTSVSFTQGFLLNQSNGVQLLRRLPDDIYLIQSLNHPHMIFEANLQFLLLYLLSSAGNDSSERVLGLLGAQGLLPKVNNPCVKIPYLLLPKARDGIQKDTFPVTCRRVAQQASCLSKRFTEHLLGSPVHERTPKHRFDGYFTCQSKGKDVSYELRTYDGTVVHSIKASDTEEVSYEAMVTTLAHENPNISTYEEAGQVVSAAKIKFRNEWNHRGWDWLPMLMKRLEASAASQEEGRDEEDHLR